MKPSKAVAEKRVSGGSSDDEADPPFIFPDLEHVPRFIWSLLQIIDPDETEAKKKLDAAVKDALTYNIKEQYDWAITSWDMFLCYAAGHLEWIPSDHGSAKDIYYTICLFYFILDRPPLGGLQTQIVPDSIDRPLTTLSAWICLFAQKVGDWMNTEASVTRESLMKLKDTKEYHWDEAYKPYPEDDKTFGFKTFNQFFCRRLLKPRPIQHNKNVVVFPADSKFDCQGDVNSKGDIVIKTIPWGIETLLGGSKYLDEFEGGTWMHAFLGPTDYHRQHAPVSGVVLEAKVIQGACYLDVEVTDSPDGKGRKTLVPHRRWRKDKNFKLRRLPHVGAEDGDGAPGRPEPDAPDGPGYQFIQTRGCIIIKNPVVGLVAVLPVGMAYVSSVNLAVQDVHRTNGQRQDSDDGDGDFDPDDPVQCEAERRKQLPRYVEKGDEISNFQFGGSDIVLVFQGKKPAMDGKPSTPGVNITAEVDKHYNYGEKLAETAS